MYLSEPTLDELTEKCGSNFVAAVVAAKRARELNDSDKLLEEYEGERFVSNAYEEIVAGKVKPKASEE
mgnify:CR=1 FL=1